MHEGCGGRLAAVVPTWNEAAAIGGVIRGLRAAGACCVYVVDAGSTDGTQAAARLAGGHVLNELRRGYGRACLTGAEAAGGHELIAFMDGDGSCDPADVAALAIECQRGADVALGRRRHPEPGALASHARLGNRMVSALIGVRTGRPLHDLAPGKVLRAEAFDALNLDATGYGWTVQVAGRALAHPGLQVVERDTTFRPRSGGESKVSGRLLPSIRAGAAMVGEGWRATTRRGLLVLMAKAPGAGHSKTRLERHLGARDTASFWEACLQDAGSRLRAVAREAGVNAMAMTTSPEDATQVRRLTGLPALVQRSAGLGQALLEVSELPAPFTIAISADVPALPQARLVEAISALRKHRAVLGPGLDGGYYLVGLRRGFSPSRRRRAFLAAPMGSADVLGHTLDALGDAHLLEPCQDVDSLPDLVELANHLPYRAAGPAVARWLAGRASGAAEAG